MARAPLAALRSLTLAALPLLFAALTYGQAPEAAVAPLGAVAVIVVDGTHPPSLAAEGYLLEVLPTLGLDVVERNRLHAALREQALTAVLADRAATVRLGEVVAARALIVVERVASAIHVRVVEVATGVVLAGIEITTAEEDEKAAAALRDAVTQAARTLREPPPNRVYLGIAPFISIHPSRENQRLAHALQPLLRSSLASTPRIVVLERAELRRLVDEERLAGAELSLRSAAVFVEGSVDGAADPDRVTVSLRLTRGGGEPISARFEAPRSLDALRETATDALSETLQLAVTPAQLEPDEEALRLLRAAPFLDWESRYATAEAALALSDDMGVLRRAADVLATALQYSRPDRRVPAAAEPEPVDTLWALALRSAEVNVTLTRRMIESLPPRQRVGGDMWHFDRVRELPRDGERAEHWRRYRELRLAAADAQAQDRLARGVDPTGIYGGLLKDVPGFADDPAEYCRESIRLLTLIRRDARHSEHESWETNAASSLIDTLDLEYRDWAIEAFAPLFDWCHAHGDHDLRLWAFEQVIEGGDDDASIAAARDQLHLLFTADLNRRSHWHFSEDTWAGRAAMEKLAEAGEFEPWVTKLLDAAESSGNLLPLLRMPESLVRSVGEHLPEPRARLWQRRAFRLSVQASRQGLSEREIGRLDNLNSSLHSSLPAQDRRLALAPTPGNPPAPGSDAANEAGVRRDGIWNYVRVEPVVFEGQDPAMHTVLQAELLLGRNPGDPAELLLLWRSDVSAPAPPTYTVTRSATTGGRLHRVARVDRPQPIFWNRLLPFRGGFLLGKGHVDAAGEFHPFNLPLALWTGHLETVDDRLFVAENGVLYEFHPDTDTRTVLASAASLAPRGGLDGLSGLSIITLFADRPNGYLYVAARTSGPAPQAVRGQRRPPPYTTGVWRYAPREDRWEQVVHGSIESLQWHGNGQLVATEVRGVSVSFWTIDRATGKAEAFRPLGVSAKETLSRSSLSALRIGESRFYLTDWRADDWPNPQDAPLGSVDRAFETAEGAWVAGRGRRHDGGPPVYRLLPRSPHTQP